MLGEVGVIDVLKALGAGAPGDLVRLVEVVPGKVRAMLLQELLSLMERLDELWVVRIVGRRGGRRSLRESKLYRGEQENSSRRRCVRAPAR